MDQLESKIEPKNQFQAFATIVLSGMIGVLFSFPLVSSSSRSVSLATMVAFGLMGMSIGYRRRESKFFFYICLVSVLVLSSIISGQMMPR